MAMSENGSRKPTIGFIANDAWFFFRHFRPAVKAALDIAGRVLVFLPEHPERPPDDLDSVSIEVIRSVRRSPFSLIAGLLSTILRLRAASCDILVGYSLRSILLLSICLPFVSCRQIVFVVTGLGYLDLDTSAIGRAKRAIVFSIMRLVCKSNRAWFVFENNYDRKRIGLAKTERQIVLMGAGVDPSAFRSSPVAFPTQILQIGFVGRLVWSKGIDVAVEAVRQLWREGLAIQLNIYGRADPANPRSFDDQIIAKWQHEECIRYCGFNAAIACIWQSNHIAVVPSRGGEGLPRSLLEAASCGKPLIVTSTAGCADFVRPGQDGLVIAPDSVDELKAAIKYFYYNRDAIPRMGASARERLVQTATTEIVENAYRALLSASPNEMQKSRICTRQGKGSTS